MISRETISSIYKVLILFLVFDNFPSKKKEYSKVYTMSQIDDRLLLSSDSSAFIQMGKSTYQPYSEKLTHLRRSWYRISPLCYENFRVNVLINNRLYLTENNGEGIFVHCRLQMSLLSNLESGDARRFDFFNEPYIVFARNPNILVHSSSRPFLCS